MIKRKLRLKYSCKFPGCMSKYCVDTSSTHRHRNKHFFSFPRECKKEQLREWKQVCCIPDDVSCNSYFVCEDHFLQKDFVNFRRERLNYGVVPKNLQLAVYYHVQCEPHSEDSASTIGQGLSAAVRVTAEIEDDSKADLQGVIPAKRNESLPMVPQLNNQEITRQSYSLPNIPQSNRPINVHIGRKRFHMVEETSEMYSLITLPYLELADPNLQWVYRILSGEEVSERIVYQSPEKDDKNGFLLIKDSKWDGTNLDNLHLIAIAYRPGIMSLRDLGAEHLCLLQNIYSSGKAVIKEKYGVLGSQLCIFIKYAPNFYHLHAHFSAVNDVSGPHFVTAHPLHSVIQNIQVFPKYYQAAALGLRLKESDKLFKEFEARGLVVRIRPSN